MRDELEDEEVWEFPQEMSPQLEGRRWSLFSRLARKRADYFSDVEDLLTQEADTSSAQGISAFRRAIEAILTQPEGLLSLTEQPTRLNLIVEAPTLLLPNVPALPDRIEATPITIKLLVTGAEARGLAAFLESQARQAWRGMRALRLRLLSVRRLWRVTFSVRRLDRLSSSSQSTDE